MHYLSSKTFHIDKSLHSDHTINKTFVLFTVNFFTCLIKTNHEINFPVAGASELVRQVRHLPDQNSKENQRVYHSNASVRQIIICAYGFNFLRRDLMKRLDRSSASTSACYDSTVMIPSKFHPPKSILFPKRSFGLKNEKRSFRPE